MESELKLELDAAAYRDLLSLRDPGVEPVEQINTFYDSEARDLRRLRFALRLRREGGHAFLTVKGAAVRQEAGYFVRPEHEVEIDAADAAALACGFRLAGCLHEPVQALAALAGDLAVAPVYAFVNYRTRIRHGPWSFELDRTLFGGLALHELEMEGEGPGLDLQDWLRSRGCSFKPATRTKLAAAEAIALAGARALGQAPGG